MLPEPMTTRRDFCAHALGVQIGELLADVEKDVETIKLVDAHETPTLPHAATSLDELLEALEQHQPGETVTLSLLRAGKPADVQVRLGLAE